jgi:hypothetical protein
MSRRDSRLERLFGDGGPAFCAAFDLVPDALGVLWAIWGPGGAIADFETGYSNQAMAQMIGVPTEASMGRRLLDEAPDFRDDETFTRMRGVLLRAAGQRSSRSRSAPATGRSDACAGSSCTGRSRSEPTECSIS